MDKFRKIVDGDYEVTLNVERILALRTFLVNKYTKTKVHYYTKYDVNMFRDNPMYNNYTYGYNYNLSNMEDRSILNDYIQSYNEVIYPDIVNLIDEILEGNISAILKLQEINKKHKKRKMSVFYQELESYIKIVNNKVNSSKPSKKGYVIIYKRIIPKR